MKYKILSICPTVANDDYLFSDNVEKTVLSFNRINSSIEPEVFFHEYLTQNIALIKNSNGILISYHCTWQEAIIIILHLRLTVEWNIENQVIIWDSEEKYTKIAFESTINGFNKSFIPNKTTQHINRHDIEDDTNINQRIEVIFSNAAKSNERIGLEQIFVKSLSSGHQITNEWGAFKLAQTAGFTTLLSKIEEIQTRSKTIYFKYLKKKYSSEVNTINTEGVSNSNSISAKYLLIDDNYDKGWKLVFSEILKQVDLGIDAFEEIKNINNENEGNIINKIKEAIENIKYQGVLLDLRLTEFDDEKGKSNTNVTDFTGGRILEALKKEFPFLPVIMVTASNKAWNMRQLLDGGADGYFIKEDPESNPREDVSTSSYEAFVQLLKNSQKKYKTLAPFWKYIDEIVKNGTLIEEKIENGTSTKIEERIKERLKMFFGLLKRSFEDSKYNEQFHYSDIKLALMTLWSCLNEIQYIYYDKSESWVNNGKTKNTIKIDPDRIKSLTLQNSYLQQRKGLTNGFNVFLKSDYNNTPHYQLLTSPIDGNYSDKIGEQIAFLVLKFGETVNISNLTSGQITSITLCNNLARIKNTRNHLYLTHGDELNSGFFQQLEKDNEEVTLEDCGQLFEIVYFLLTGNYVQINI